MPIEGFATREGTEAYCRKMGDRCSPDHFKQVEDLVWSSIGLGTYLGSADSRTDELVAKAAVRSVSSGINVIDTAINYRRQHAERSVGQALRILTESGKFKRQELIICTKGGFIPHPDAPNWFQREVVQAGRGGVSMGDLVADCHCMHPEYLADQLEYSRTNLGIETVDVYYLHNPETQLGLVDEDTFYSRLETAFRWLEETAVEGKIRYYGLATWSGFRVSPENPRHISLERTKTLARKAAGEKEDRFRFIQLPFNLEMPQAVGVATQNIGNETLAPVAAARRLGIYPVISGSIGQGKMDALPREMVEALSNGYNSDGMRAMQFTRSTPGIATALIGMKQPRHVEENLALCRMPLLDETNFEKFLHLD